MSCLCAILSFNHAEITRKAISSALQFFLSENILLVHNGSEQKNVSLLQDYFPEINHHVIEENKGYSGGVNGAFNWFLDSRKDFQWFFLVTNDCEVEHFLDHSLLKKLLEGVYAPRILFKSGKIDSLGGIVNCRRGRPLHLRLGEGVEGPLVLKESEFLYVPGSSFLISRGLLKKVGGLDERIFTFWDDIDWSLRLQQQSGKIFLLPEVVLKHGGGKTTHHQQLYTTYYYQRNRWAVSKRYLSFAGKWHLFFWWWRDAIQFRGLSLFKKHPEKSHPVFLMRKAWAERNLPNKTV